MCWLKLRKLGPQLSWQYPIWLETGGRKGEKRVSGKTKGHWILTGGSTEVAVGSIIVDLFVRDADVALVREGSRTVRGRERGE